MRNVAEDRCPDQSKAGAGHSRRQECLFCGHEFALDQAGVGCAAACGASGSCGRVRCPRCGYEVVEDPKWAETLRNWWKGRPWRRPHPAPPSGAVPVSSAGAVPLSAMRAGEWGVVVARTGATPKDSLNAIRKLTSLGVLPGAIIKLECRRPGFVFALGNARIAVDRRLAGEVLVDIIRPGR